jgi:sodium-dependent dicarboxylate transporter 2/3/5
MLFSKKWTSLLLGPALLIFSLVLGVLVDKSSLFLVVGMVLWMIVWWISDVVPIAATSMLPVIVLPVSGLLTIKEVTTNYANPIIYLFMGGFFIAIAMEKSGLHKRIALNILQRTGSSANGIIFGFLLATAFISMWVSNTATTLMMLPIAASVSAIVHQQVISAKSVSKKNFDIALMLGIAYAANIGGAATLIGTPPNVVLAGMVRDILQMKLSFGGFMCMGVPLMLLMLLFSYLVLVKWLFPNNIGSVERLPSIIQAQLSELGAWSKKEKSVAIVFGMVSFFWIMGQPFNALLKQNIFDDTVVAVLGAILLFTFPIQLKELTFVLEWKDARQLPWNILLLFGGGLSIAEGMNKVGLMKILGDAILGFTDFSPFFMLLLLTFLMLMMTELMSNVALASIFIPVVMGIAQSIHANAVGFAVSVAVASSHAFMLPVGTPPNAIVYGTGKVTIYEMFRAGLMLNIIAVLVICFMVYLFYGLNG